MSSQCLTLVRIPGVLHVGQRAGEAGPEALWGEDHRHDLLATKEMKCKQTGRGCAVSLMRGGHLQDFIGMTFQSRGQRDDQACLVQAALTSLGVEDS